MQMGLLWFDNDPGRELAAKVEDAARRYRDKFGSAPDTCYVNRAAVEGQEMVVRFGESKGRSVRVLPAGNVLPHHFWIGVEDVRDRTEAVLG
jgi:hypothetical protein